MAGQAVLEMELDCPKSISQIVGAHHGKPQSLDFDLEEEIARRKSNYYGSKSNRNPEFWKRIRKEWYQYALAETGFDERGFPAIDRKAQMVLSGLLIMADWIASNTNYFPLLSLDETGDKTSYPERVDAAWDKICFPFPWSPGCFGMDEELFLERFGFAPNPVQKAMLEAVNGSLRPGIYILEAQMGVGKTEAALGAAEIAAAKSGAGGLFFGMPTQATANGIFPRLKSWAKKQSMETLYAIRLAHGMAELNEDYRRLFIGTANVGEVDQTDGLIVHEWFGGRKTALLANFVIGTVDQVLMAALKQKHVMLRHLGLSGKVVIIDECHAYDAYMNQYLDRALNWLGAYQVPVIMLSATLPLQRRKELVQAYLNSDVAEKNKNREWKELTYPLLTWTDEEGVHQKEILYSEENKKISVETICDEEVLEKLTSCMDAGGCAGLIVNTVKRAQGFAEMLRAKLADCELIVYHAQFIQPDRVRKEASLLKRVGKDSDQKERSRVVVIGTQVLEQSLDIDFDFLITDLCPMDLLLQRIGRLHRHMRPDRPTAFLEAHCSIIIQKDGEIEKGAGFIYGEWLLERTLKLLPERISLPSDIPFLVQKTYEIPTIEDQDEAYQQYLVRIGDQGEKAKRFRIGEPSEWGDMAGMLDFETGGGEKEGLAAVRDGDSSIEVLLMKKARNGKISLIGNDIMEFASYHLPDDEACRRIAAQRIRLPHRFCYKIREVIEELEDRNRKELSEWQQSSWISGELILLLDETGRGEICGIKVRYQADVGLRIIEEEGI